MKATSARSKRKKHHAAKPQLLVERSAHVEHRGREGEDMASLPSNTVETWVEFLNTLYST